MLPADMTTVTLVFIDVTNDCILEQTIGPLNPCSTNCVITADMLSFICNGNGTPTDPLDDFYDVEILATVINGSSINRYNVSIDGVISYSFEYGVLSTFSLPATGLITTISLIDAEDVACSINESIGPLEPCSDACVITSEVLNLSCNDNGTEEDNSDDIYFFDLTVGGINTGQMYEIVGLGISGVYGTTTTLGPFEISAGPLSILITDVLDPDCAEGFEVMPPMACSDCNQTLSLSEPGILSCTEPETMIMVNASEQGIYSWSGPDGFSSTLETITVSVPGIYEVLVSFFNGCTQTTSVEVFSDNNIPIALAGPDQSLTCGIEEVILDASNSIYPNGATFQWTDELGVELSTDLMLTVTEAGSYYFLIIDPLTGCNSALEEVVVDLDLSGPSSFITADPGNVLDCETSSVMLSSAEEPGVVYSWLVDGQIATPPIIITEGSSITLNAYDEQTECDSETTLTILDLGELPQIELGTTGEIGCEGGESCIEVLNVASGSNLEYSWSDDQGQSIGGFNATQLCVQEAGEYLVTLFDPDTGCSTTSSVSIEGPVIGSVELPGNITIMPGETGELTANVDIPAEDILEIIWSPAEYVSCQDCLTTTVSDAPNGQLITVEVITITGCRTSDATLIQSNVSIEVNIPNIFNPDSEIGNEAFTLYGNDQVLMIEEMYVFDRWGEMVFKAEGIPPNDPTLGWDGRFKGQRAAQGVYVYLFKVLFADNRSEIYTGDITLLQ